MTLELGNIKGAAFAEFVLWYESFVDAHRARRVLCELDAAHPATFDPERKGYGILASRWYPAELVHELVDALIAEHPASELDGMAQRAADYIMGQTLSGVYKFLFSTVANPKLYAKHVGKLWAMHYDTGTVVMEPEGDDTWRASYEDWKAHHPFICKMNMASARPIYQAMGCRQVEWRKLGCISDGDARCSSRIRYEP